ncbi:SgcJ/EcaC family oxidoreductase [Pseudomonas cremoricolorata]|uniref:Protein kinase n=1 Tax=Pseudomonas cremoricolorata TaxID=157783 RepID=A0A089WR67_9PSED|nr:SgcJ/EcaC family oxidoreductase [Pseudomonas cremoricolorata]AIR91081.1 protein kinase [Pseudomonas cremoricolorata]
MTATASLAAPTQSCADVEMACLAAAKAALYRWAATVSTRDVDAVLALYASDAILVPTLSNQVRDCRDSRRGYFEQFLANDGLVCDIQVFTKRVSRKLGTVVVGGLYTFVYREDGQPRTVPARFLFTFEQIDGQWLITGHHSSLEA